MKTPANLIDLRRVWIGRSVRGSSPADASRTPDRLVESIDQNAEDGRFCALSVSDGDGEQVIADSPCELHLLLCQLGRSLGMNGSPLTLRLDGAEAADGESRTAASMKGGKGTKKGRAGVNFKPD